MSEYADRGYDEFLAAVDDGEPYYLECANGHGHLPPRRVCPDCGSREFVRSALPESGEVVTYTVTHVASPDFADDAPYVTAVVDFGPVRLTAAFDVDPGEAETGTVVGLDVDERETTGDPLLVVRPR